MAGSTSRWGLVFGFGAILSWSFGAAAVSLAAPVIGAWRFIGLTALIGSATQVLWRWWSYRDLRPAVLLPPKLWFVTLFGFVLNILCYMLAIAMARTDAQRCAVNLINYLWPPLTVVFGVMWVPGTRFQWTLALALLCAVAGTVLANRNPIGGAPTSTGWEHDAGRLSEALPYLLASIGAVTWASYSTLLARWRNWAGRYNTTAVGLLILGVIATLGSVPFDGSDLRLTPTAGVITVLFGLVTQGGGYLLWERALSRADVKALGLIGSATPVLSTLWLCASLRYVPGDELWLAALLVSLAAVLGARSQVISGPNCGTTLGE